MGQFKSEFDRHDLDKEMVESIEEMRLVFNMDKGISLGLKSEGNENY